MQDILAHNEIMSLFDSGNIGNYDISEASVSSTSSRTLTITFCSRPDPVPSDVNDQLIEHRSWFNFLVHNVFGFDVDVLVFQWINAPSPRKQVKNGYKPVYRTISRAHDSIIQAIKKAETVGVPDYSVMLPTHNQLPFRYTEAESFTNSKGTFLGFSIRIPRGTTCVQIAFTFPYPLNEISLRMQELRSIYPVVEEQLSNETIMYRIARHPDLPILYFSARCHPGETPGSYVLEGILRNLSRLLNWFEIWIVPAINAEGIRRGHYRTDAAGNDLNRCYVEDSSLITGKILSKIKSQGANTGMLQASSEKLIKAFCRICHTPTFRNFTGPRSPSGVGVTSKLRDPDDQQTCFYPMSSDRFNELARCVSQSTHTGVYETSNPAMELPVSYFTDSTVTPVESLRSSAVIRPSFSMSTISPSTVEDRIHSSGRKRSDTTHTIVIQPKPPFNYPTKQCVIFCLDLHAHASIPNCFLLGNSQFSSISPEHDNILDCSMAELRSLLFSVLAHSSIKGFDIMRSDFSPCSMYKQDRSGNSYRHTMRVGFHSATRLPNIYCFETHYFRQVQARKTSRFNISNFIAMGQGLASAIEAYFMLDPPVIISALRKLELYANRISVDTRFYILLKELKTRLGKDYFSRIYELIFDQLDNQCCGSIRRRI
ncbi:Metallocarboxypeptidase/ M14 family/ Nuclear ATP/GTP-binding protein [Giardia duodenalis assemblage B]|uniref:Metallocarboxypeptidase/ M14 family/ Nuclear ATP/GTP-binding protein n=1 Tax=Giardia duodenalis assemblage B TaxID=1394984 RepID=A0A132NNN7_GIAIN|nr:Metallocarboxypeptidase/ M14 family/ Nuclear ATP/GTP-binding protein [Giardia intestinalis assemblage B]